MAEHAREGRHVIIATPAASGKSLGYLLPALTGIGEGGTALYLAPTRALAADQLRVDQRARACRVSAPPWWTGTRPRRRGTGPARTPTTCSPPRTCCTRRCCPGTHGGTASSAGCATSIVDECHTYRGVFGSHVAQVLRRLHRIAAHHGGPDPAGAGPAWPGSFLLASATVSEPGRLRVPADRRSG